MSRPRGAAPLMTWLVTLVVLVLFSVTRRAWAQTTTVGPHFEIASIKPNRSAEINIGVRDEPGGRFVATNVPLRQLIAIAYKLRDVQLIGGPSWIGSERFDVVAKASGELPPFNPSGPIGPTERMLQTLLAERFHLVTHAESREMPIYALVLARADGRLGARLVPSPVDCAVTVAERSRAGRPLDGPVMAGDRIACGMMISPWAIRIGGAPMVQIATALSQTARRYVVDRTGLTGNYDVDLQWTPQGVPLARPPGGDLPGPPMAIPPPDPNGPTFETAIQEQLGLKLQPERSLVPVVVIDDARPPDPD